MIKIGLTGSIGMGKSTTSTFFKERGVPVYDADAAVHRLYTGEALEIVAKHFPSAIVDSKVDRQKLGAIVLQDQKSLKKLEAMIHPLVAKDRLNFLEMLRKQATPVCVLDIPLLFETNATAAIDVIVVVSTTAALQHKRVMARPGMTDEKFAAILAKQIPDADKRKMAHCVINTGSGVDFARRQVGNLLRALNG